MGKIIPQKYEMGCYPSSEEIADAIAKFKEEGGLIKKLPEQKNQIDRRILPKNMKDDSPYIDVGVLNQ